MQEKVFTEAEQQLLTHLKGLKEMGVVELTQPMLQQLEALEAKQKELVADKELNHGHVNRSKKLKAQLEAIAAKLLALDKEWKNFIFSIGQKVQRHQALYQQCREEIVQSKNAKMAELKMLKEEMAAASQKMMDALPQEDMQSTEDDLDQRMAAFQQTMAEAADLVNLVSEDEMETGQPEDVELLKDGDQKRKPNFRGSPSPTKVATSHLKVKIDKDVKR